MIVDILVDMLCPIKEICLICSIGEMSHLVKDTETSCWWWPLLDGFVQDVVTWHHDAHVDHLEKRSKAGGKRGTGEPSGEDLPTTGLVGVLYGLYGVI
jgi:hypothetical protein